MRAWILTLSALLTTSALIAADGPNKLAKVDKLPDGLGASIAAELNAAGHSVAGPDGTVCDVWFVKSAALKPEFKPSLSVKYPLTPGALVGVLRVPEKADFTDFRGSQVKPGVYTLRYGQQPQDGNHLGTSDVADFLLAVPAAADTEAKPITTVDQLNKSSAKASGTTHPAIFLLLSADEPAEAPSLSHDDDHDYWILSVTIDGKDGDKKVRLPIRLVTLGQSEA